MRITKFTYKLSFLFLIIGIIPFAPLYFNNTVKDRVPGDFLRMFSGEILYILTAGLIYLVLLVILMYKYQEKLFEIYET